MAPPKKGTLQQRFWSYVKKTSGCWVWTGPLSCYGYGLLSIGHHGQIKAHRLSWEMHNGDVPDGLCVLHRCDVRNCVAPHHLWLGTRGENTLDMFAKGRDHRSKIRRQSNAMF